MTGYRATFAAFVLVILSGCGHIHAYVDAAVDPSFAPKKSDPVYVILSPKSSIRERQLLVPLRNELCRSHFNVVDDLAKSEWALGLAADRQTFDTGVTSSAVQVMGTPLVVGSAHRNTQTNQFAYLYLFKSSDLASQKPVTVWEGQVSAENRDFNEYEQTIFKGLLDVYGTNYSDETNIDKGYFNKVVECRSKRLSSTDCDCGKL
jgi:hypothetical protein